MPVELDGRPGRLVLQGAHLNPRATIHWHLDQRFLGSTQGIHELEVWPGPGERHLTLVDNTGARLQRSFTVIAVSREGRNAP